MGREEAREAIIDCSFGVISTAINLTLSLVIFGSEFASGGRNPLSVTKAAEAASTFTGVSKETLRRSLWKAQHLGLLRRRRERGKEFWETTKQGRIRLNAELPTYISNRPWNGRLYLVTYDIPEKNRQNREKLRQYLKNIGAGRLQFSTYLMLWDPTEVLKRFIRNHNLSGMVIVSDTGSDGSIGDRDLDELVWDVFDLEELNRRYYDFLKEAKRKETRQERLAFLYLSILKDDPQLPFGLLPPTWSGDKSYRAFQNLIGTQALIFLSAQRPQPKKKE